MQLFESLESVTLNKSLKNINEPKNAPKIKRPKTKQQLPARGFPFSQQQQQRQSIQKKLQMLRK